MLLLLSFFYLMVKPGKSFVKIRSRFQIALFFLFIEISNTLYLFDFKCPPPPPPVIRIPRLFGTVTNKDRISHSCALFRSSPSMAVCKRAVLENFQNSQKKKGNGASFSTNLLALVLQFHWKVTPTQVLYYEFCRTLNDSFFCRPFHRKLMNSYFCLLLTFSKLLNLPFSRHSTMETPDQCVKAAQS